MISAQPYPSGVVTLVFTDIVGYSPLCKRYGEAFKPVQGKHNDFVREAAERWNGFVAGLRGDGFFLVFTDPSDAVRFAVDAQLALARHPWTIQASSSSNSEPSEPLDLRVRIGIHTGQASLFDPRGGEAQEYYGSDVNCARRVCDTAYGGQILVSGATREAASLQVPPEIRFKDMGGYPLKGIGDARLWQVQHSGLRDDFSPAINLPLEGTPFVGREAEVDLYRDKLREPQTRLLAFIGFGGIGKTRCALRLARLCAEEEDRMAHFPDGICWVALEEVRSGAAMLERIAHETVRDLQPGRPLKDQLWEFLRQRQMLLILDNLEQIPDGPQVVHELLSRAPALKCVVTSRHDPGLQAETRIEVPPLSPCEAIHLFIERARSRGRHLSAEDADVVQLCGGLEGVPLAIELAAARIVGLTPREMLDRLGTRLQWLKINAPDMPDRQQALRATVDWSYGLLSDEERSVFAQLGVFAGGFTLPAAETICRSPDAFESVQELHGHSLLRAQAGGAQTTRYSMLEPLRDYAMERLHKDSEAEEAARRRHAEFFLAFAQERAARLRTVDEAHALEEALSELDNMRGALAWLGTGGKEQARARLSLALGQLLHRRGFWTQARECFEGGLGGHRHMNGRRHEQGVPEQMLQARLALHLASVLHDLGEAAASRERAEASLALCRKRNDAAGEADALNLLGVLDYDAGRDEEARHRGEEALRLRTRGDHNGHAITLHNLARLADRRGDYGEARRLYEASLSHRRRAVDRRGEAETLGNLGATEHNAGEYRKAREIYQESLSLSRGLGDRYGIARMMHNLGELAELDGEDERPVSLFAHAARLFGELQSPYALDSEEALKRLREKLGSQRFAILQRAAESATWEEAARSEIARR